MNKILILTLIISSISISSYAEMVTEKGKHRHVGNVSKNQSCKIAEQKATEVTNEARNLGYPLKVQLQEDK